MVKMDETDTKEEQDEFELERLRAELSQENQMKEMLEQSLGELHITVDELEKRIDSIGEENNEWKTRFETQTEVNQQLEKQIILLNEKVEEARKTVKEYKLPKHLKNPAAEVAEVTPHYLKQMEKEKGILEKQLRDLEWRLDQESKAYHKANEERKQFLLEINAARESLTNLSHRQKHGALDALTPRQPAGTVNIAQNQRIIDPKRGPIKKTAAVKSLPKLD